MYYLGLETALVKFPVLLNNSNIKFYGNASKHGYLQTK